MLRSRRLRSMLGVLGVVLAACAPAAPAAPTAAPAAAPTKPAAPAPPAAASSSPQAAASPAAVPSASPVAAPAASPAAKPSAAFEQLREAARKEGALTAWISTPAQESTHKALFDAFKQRFGLDQLQTEWLPLFETESNPRLVAEAQAGRPGPDVISSSTRTMIPPGEAGLLEEYDWVGVFGQELPTIKESVERVIPEYRGKALGHYDALQTLLYNTSAVPAAEVPNRLEDLVDPKWRGKFAISGTTSLPFETLSLLLGREPTLDLVRKLAANQPQLQRTVLVVVSAVSSGEAPLGIGSAAIASAEQAKGAPIGIKLMPSYTLVLPLHVYVPKNAQHPNMARLFAAWMVTEGMKIQEEREYLARVTDPSFRLTQRIRAETPNAPLVAAKNLEQVQAENSIREEIIRIWTTPR
jgi:ABC-type Fe3+ transport system substrate-binding protein